MEWNVCSVICTIPLFRFFCFYKVNFQKICSKFVANIHAPRMMYNVYNLSKKAHILNFRSFASFTNLEMAIKNSYHTKDMV